MNDKIVSLGPAVSLGPLPSPAPTHTQSSYAWGLTG